MGEAHMTDTVGTPAFTHAEPRAALLAKALRAVADKVAAADRAVCDRLVIEVRGRFNRERAARGLEPFDGGDLY
jgi:hypothetical protein